MILLARISAGLLLWAFGFSLLYALHGMGCAGGWTEVQMLGGTVFRWMLVSCWVLLLLAAISVIRLAWAAPSKFEKRVSLATALAGAGAILVTGSPVALTSACA
ncbi:MAG: hypothetical protein KIS73_23950 [Enhydrobacter sp.]|nr:hypothetical protein [Enhydrobacter sp.]